MNALLIAEAERTEFQAAIDTLANCGAIVRVPDPMAAIALLEREPHFPDVIVIAQAYPGQFAHEALDRLRRQAPLARFVLLAGSWCEGEVRSGSPWPGAVRVYWHQAVEYLREEFSGTRLALPVTASEEERLLAEAAVALPQNSGLIVIVSSRPAQAAWIADACRQCGYSTVCLPPYGPVHVHGAVAGIYDATDATGLEESLVPRLTGALAPAPLVVLLDFPRIEDERRLLAAGAAAVVSKPVWLASLLRPVVRTICTTSLG